MNSHLFFIFVSSCMEGDIFPRWNIWRLFHVEPRSWSKIWLSEWAPPILAIFQRGNAGNDLVWFWSKARLSSQDLLPTTRNWPQVSSRGIWISVRINISISIRKSFLKIVNHSCFLKKTWQARFMNLLACFRIFDICNYPCTKLFLTIIRAAQGHVPRHFKFVGSNSEKCGTEAKWTTICEAKVTKALESKDEVRGCSTLQEKPSPKYHCLGLQILETKGGEWASLRNIRIWTKI